ncbi:MAG TPA: hypothetical protein ENI23_08835 [bacterium]|nr:hypothetical protein [bacterium]
MKTGKLFTIDVEIAEKLQNLNASSLVNGLLKEYFELRSDKNTLKDEKTAVLQSINKKKRYFLKKLKLLKSGIHCLWIIFRANGFRPEKNYLHLAKFLLIGPGEELIIRQETLKGRMNSGLNMENC